MAGPFDRAQRMYGLPQFGINPALTPRRDDPSQARLRTALEGPVAPQMDANGFSDEDWALAESTGSPYDIIEAVRQMREERATTDFLGSIAQLNPEDPKYTESLRDAFVTNPRAASSPEAMRMLQFQQQLIPKTKDFTSQFRDPVYRSSYQQRVKGGASPEVAYEETLAEAANEEMAIKLIESGIPASKHGDLMTGNAFDRRKVAQAIADRGTELPRSELNELLKLASEYQKAYADPVTWSEASAREKGGDYDVAAREWFGRTSEGQEPSTPQDWEKAYYGLRDERVRGPLQAWQQRLGAIEGQYRVPDALRGLVGGVPQSPVAPATAIPTPQADVTPPTPQNVSETAVEAVEIPSGEAVAEETITEPAGVDTLWQEYMELFENDQLNREDFDNKTATEEDREFIKQTEKDRIAKRNQIMRHYGFKNDDAGEMRFEEMFKNRQKAGFKDYSSLWQ